MADTENNKLSEDEQVREAELEAMGPGEAPEDEL